MTHGNLTALVVEIEDHFDLVELDGVIASVALPEIAVLSRSGEETLVAVTAGTFVMWRGDILSIADLDPGSRAEVKAFRDPGGVLVALRIKLKDDAPGE
jgi:hypothetical protein